MQEYVSEAVVLGKMPHKQADARYSIFTERFGKMVAKATGSRKIISKLAGHLEPGSFVRVRLIEKNDLRLVDALKEGFVATPISLQNLHQLDRLLAEGEKEPAIWDIVRAGKFNWNEILLALGWDPASAACAMCGAEDLKGFSIRHQDFFCDACFKKMPKNEMIFLS